MKNTFTFTVAIDSCTLEEAEIVMAERLGYDEDYGFDYTIDWSRNEDL